MLTKTKMNLFYKHEYSVKIIVNSSVLFNENCFVLFNENCSVLFNENCSLQCKCEHELFCILNG